MQRLRLTPLQRDQLLLMRKNHLRNLRQVYEGRQQLNMQVRAALCLQTHSVTCDNVPRLDVWTIDCMSRAAEEMRYALQRASCILYNKAVLWCAGS